MKRVHEEHLGFAAVGAFIARSKALSEVEWRGRGFFNYAWPVFMIVLGVLLLLYME